MILKRTLFVILVIVLVILGCLPVFRSMEDGPVDNAMRRHARGEFAMLSHGQVHYRDRGLRGGDVVVFVHGFSVPSYTWERNAAFLAARGYRVITYDLYGRGFSDRPEGPYTRRFMVEQLEELLAYLKVDKPVVLVSISMGGAIAARYAVKHPDGVQAAVFMAPFYRPVDVGVLALPLIGEWVAYSFYVPGLPAAQLNDFANPGAFNDWPVRYQYQMQYDGFGHALLSSSRHLLQTNPMADFKMIGQGEMATLLLWGEKDSVFEISAAPTVARALGRHNTLVKVEQAAHALHYEHADEVNDQLYQFLLDQLP